MRLSRGRRRGTRRLGVVSEEVVVAAAAAAAAAVEGGGGSVYSPRPCMRLWSVGGRPRAS